MDCSAEVSVPAALLSPLPLLCVQKRIHRFTLRSKRKVDVQWRLFALVHNIGKIHTFGTLI